MVASRAKRTAPRYEPQPDDGEDYIEGITTTPQEALIIEADYEEVLTPPKYHTAHSTGPYSAKTITIQQKALEAVELRKQGKSYREIADTLNYSSTNTAQKAVMGMLKEMLGEPAEELRQLEASRIDELWYGVREMFESADSPLLKLYAVDRLLKLSERRSKLLGLDAPVKVNLEVKIRQMALALGLDEEEAVSELRSVVTWTGSPQAGNYIRAGLQGVGGDPLIDTNVKLGFIPGG